MFFSALFIHFLLVRVMFGTSHLYVFHHPAEMQSSSLKQADITYEMAQEEIAKNAGLDVDDQESKGDLALVHITLETFENEALFLRSGLPSTLSNPSRRRGLFGNALQTEGI